VANKIAARRPAMHVGEGKTAFGELDQEFLHVPWRRWNPFARRSLHKGEHLKYLKL